MNRPRPGPIAASAIAAWIALATTRCTDTPRRDASIDADASGAIEGGIPGVDVSLGTGQIDYEDIPTHGGTVELIFGPQGGYHVWGRARFHGFAPDVDVQFTVTRLSDEVLLHAPSSIHRWIADGVSHGLVDLGGGSFGTNAEQVVLAIHCSAEVIGESVRIDLAVTERASGRTATDSRVVTVVDNDPSPPCVPDR